MIRVWKLGNAEKGIYVSSEGVILLANILKSLKDDNGNFKDIVWGSDDLEVILIPENSKELKDLQVDYDLIAVLKAPKVKPEELNESAKLDSGS